MNMGVTSLVLFPFSNKSRAQYLSPPDNFLISPLLSCSSPFGSSMVAILTGGAARASSGFAAPDAGKWTSYSIPFREDQGWSYFETGEAISFQAFRNILANLTSVQIRGDDRVCSNQGEGQEAVYVQNVVYEIDPNK